METLALIAPKGLVILKSQAPSAGEFVAVLEVQDNSVADATIANDRRRKADVLIVVLRKSSTSEESVNTKSIYVARGQPERNHEVLDEFNEWRQEQNAQSANAQHTNLAQRSLQPDLGL